MEVSKKKKKKKPCRRFTSLKVAEVDLHLFTAKILEKKKGMWWFLERIRIRVMGIPKAPKEKMWVRCFRKTANGCVKKLEGKKKKWLPTWNQPKGWHGIRCNRVWVTWLGTEEGADQNCYVHLEPHPSSAGTHQPHKKEHKRQSLQKECPPPCPKAFSLMIPRGTVWIFSLLTSTEKSQKQAGFKVGSDSTTIVKSREGRPGQKSLFPFLKHKKWGTGDGMGWLQNHYLIFLVHPSVLP